MEGYRRIDDIEATSIPDGINVMSIEVNTTCRRKNPCQII